MTQQPGELNKVEAWVADHALPIFAVLATLIVIGAGLVFFTYQNTGDVEHQVDVLKPKIVNGAPKCTAHSLDDGRQARACAARLRIGLINCRRSEPCRAALIAAITYPADAAIAEPGGGGALNPSTAGQQPSPGQPGHTGGGTHHGGSGHEGTHEQPATEPPPSPSPAPEGSQASTPTPAPEAADSGDQGSQGDSSTSGTHVELCALERICVEVDPKGLLP